jgi:hypothetical protein
LEILVSKEINSVISHNIFQLVRGYFHKPLKKSVSHIIIEFVAIQSAIGESNWPNFKDWILENKLFCYATINAAYNQHSLQSTPLFPACTFSTVITTSMVQDLNEKKLWH